MPRTASAVFFMPGDQLRAPHASASRTMTTERAGGARSSSWSAFAAAMSGSVALDRAPRQHAGHEQAIDLVGPFEDPVDARVAVVPLGGIVLHEAVAAVNLHVLVEDEVEHLG